MRTREDIRFQRERHIERKEYILTTFRRDNPPHNYGKCVSGIDFPRDESVNFEGYWVPYVAVKHRGALSKGKVHYGDSWYQNKTKNKGRKRKIHGNYNPSISYKASDMRKIQSMDLKEKELN